MTPSQTLPQVTPRKRRVVIDLIRFLGCLSIAIWHYQHFSFVGLAVPNFNIEQQPFYDWVSLFYEHGGRFRVQTFWSISGFVMMLSYGRAIAEHQITPRVFFFDRVARLYPLYLVGVTLAALLQFVYLRTFGEYFVYGNNTLWQAVSTLFMASAWLPSPQPSFNGPVWSLSILIPIYAGFFYSIWRFRLSIRANLIVIVATSLLYWVFNDTRMLECAANFHAGVIGAIVLLRFGDGRYRVPLMVLAVAALALFVLATQTLGEAYVVPGLYIILLFVVPISCYAAANISHIPKFLHLLFQWLGSLSYGVFLLHFPLQLATVLIAGRFGLTLPVLSPWFFLAYLGTTLLLAQIGLILVEQPAQRALRRLFGTGQDSR